MPRSNTQPTYEITINGTTHTGSYDLIRELRQQAIRYGIGCSGITVRV
jgi:glutamate/tyrosine decarboxylase-like PLP-dependent enzyme